MLLPVMSDTPRVLYGYRAKLATPETKKISPKKPPRPEAVIAYVDGFNLYHGMKDANFRRFYWLDITKLCRALLKDGQDLVTVRYFTSRIAEPKYKRLRQVKYLEAIEATLGIRSYYGTRKTSFQRCGECGYVNKVSTEKGTDVNLAIQMLTDAHNGRFDAALLVSGDTDFCGLVRAVLKLRRSYRVVVAFPLERYNAELAGVASVWLNIGRANLAGSQYPDEVKSRDGFVLRRPTHWTAKAEEAAIAARKARKARKGGLDSDPDTPIFKRPRR